MPESSITQVQHGMLPQPKAASACSVMFNFLGRDFFTALSNKDIDTFYVMLAKWLAALCAGIPVFVFRDYYLVRDGGRMHTVSPFLPRAWALWSQNPLSVDVQQSGVAVCRSSSACLLWMLTRTYRQLQRQELPFSDKWSARVCAQSKLALEWREWMTERFTSEYFQERTFYQVQAGGLLDNPDQRISSDVRCCLEAV